MKRPWLSLLAGLFLLTSVAAAHAQKQKQADVSGLSFVSGPKGDHPHVPGLNAIFLFTEQQKQQLVQAYQETIGSEAVRAAGRKVKNDPAATDADREAARRLSEEAQTKYEQRVGQILTAPQKELALSLKVIYGQAIDAATAEYRQKLVGAKGNQAETMKLRDEMREFQSADFLRRVNEILSVEQRDAFEQAAAAERQRDAAKEKNRG